ncbi:MAG: hypothetical protein AB1564_10705 [Chloroflexota bacterium]
MTTGKSYNLNDLPEEFRKIIKYTTNQIRNFGNAMLLPEFSYDLVQLIYSVDFDDETKNSIAKDFRNLVYEAFGDNKDYFHEKANLIENKRDEYMQSLYSQGLVYHWAIIENYVKQLLAALINFDNKILEREAFGSIKIPMSEFFGLDEKDRGMFLANLIIASISSGKKPKYGVDKFEQYLEFFELNGSLNKDDKRNILALHCFRNCIVHNDSNVDERLVEHCGWLNLKLNDRIVIKDEDFRAYESSILVYIHEIYYRLNVYLGAPEITLKSLRGEIDKIISRNKNT